MNEIKVLLGKKIREIRKKRGFTQEKLADLAEIEIASLSNIENGKNYPNHDTLRRIANAFNMPVFELFIFDYFKDDEILISEMTDEMRKNSSLTKKMYQFFMCVK